MQKLIIIVLVLLGSLTIQAQTNISSFFDEDGLMRPESLELKELSDTLVTMSPRPCDVEWSRVVYRIVDMRFKQNYQLYTPISAEDPMYSSLLKTMLLAIADSMPVYSKSENGDIRPIFHNDNEKIGEEMLGLLDWDSDVMKEEAVLVDERVLKYDDNQKLILNARSFSDYAKNQLKYLIKEVVYFDRHYSRLYSKILAIAPMHADKVDLIGKTPMEAIYGQILFWVKYDDFRPYMAQQYVTPRGNDSKRVTFDDFFQLKLYSSYILGINNVYSRMVPELYQQIEDPVAKQRAIYREQQKIETELLNFEQDLWEY
jgi:gliding motility associated protien GldN